LMLIELARSHQRWILDTAIDVNWTSPQQSSVLNIGHCYWC